MRTLYVSDLDGTLLRSDQRTSEYTNNVINGLVEKGMIFSYATARSYITARKVTEGLSAPFPLIIYNGAFVRDNATGEMLLRNFFSPEEGVALVRYLLENDIRPIVYAFVDGEEKFSYMAQTMNPGVKDFVLSRKGDVRDRPVREPEELLKGEVFYLTCIDEPDKLKPVLDKYISKYHCVYQRDFYSGDQWLEIMPANASKSAAIRQLKTLLHCHRLVVFGDGMNDLDMFRIADEAYAVENAVPELKAAATGIIGSNDRDGVAQWLYAHFQMSS